jgi:enterochelin esterase-like enzyme
MRFLNIGKLLNKRLIQRIFFPSGDGTELHVLENVPSKALGRDVKVRIVLPPGYFQTQRAYPSLYLNDGQDLEALGMMATLDRLYRLEKIEPFVLIAVHANEDRMQEYGTAGQPDYKKRGKKAAKYSHFLLEELLPMLHRRYRLLDDKAQRTIAGFSLGGLSAFDIAWKHPDTFSKVGVFSGSLWWRSEPFDPKQPDADRIVQTMVEKGPKREGLKFWLQAGTQDEQADRNNNGIIDAIDDTLDLVAGLKAIGYNQKDIHYLEVSGGKHNPKTWGQVMPDFLQWAFPLLVTQATNK